MCYDRLYIRYSVPPYIFRKNSLDYRNHDTNRVIIFVTKFKLTCIPLSHLDFSFTVNLVQLNYQNPVVAFQ